MAISIELVDIKIDYWRVNMVDARLDVHFRYMDASAETWKEDDAVFWQTMPEMEIDPVTGEPYPVPDNWFSIPSEYITELAGLNTAIDNALTTRFL